MKLHKVTFYVVDHDELGAEGVRQEIYANRWANHCMDPRLVDVETKDIGAWHQDHHANYNHADLSLYFGDNPPQTKPLGAVTMEDLARYNCINLPVAIADEGPDHVGWIHSVEGERVFIRLKRGGHGPQYIARHYSELLFCEHDLEPVL